jgi:hypothetical protein
MSPKIVRLPGQFSAPGSDLIVATPTCCCCCCCCLVTTSSILAYSTGIVVNESRKVEAAKSNRFWLGSLAFAAFPLSIGLGILFFRASLLLSLFLGMILFVAFLARIAQYASNNSRPMKDFLPECGKFALLATLCFSVEFVTVGLFVFGQIAAAIVPFVIGHRRSWRGFPGHGNKKLETAAPAPSEFGVLPRCDSPGNDSN